MPHQQKKMKTVTAPIAVLDTVVEAALDRCEVVSDPMISWTISSVGSLLMEDWDLSLSLSIAIRYDVRDFLLQLLSSPLHLCCSMRLWTLHLYSMN